MTTRDVARASLGAATLLIALAGCSNDAAEPPPTPSVDIAGLGDGGNGIWRASPDVARAAIVDAVRDAGAVRYEGTFTELVPAEDPNAPPTQGRTLTVTYAGDDGTSTTSIAAGDVTVEIVEVAGRAYVRGNAAYAAHTGVEAFQLGFVCTTSPEALLSEWSPLLDPDRLIEALLGSSDSIGVMEPDDGETTTTVVLGSEEAPVGEMTISARGPALPSDFVAGDGSGDGALTFTGWGEAVDVEPPAEITQDCG